jgi:hypothetical protein
MIFFIANNFSSVVDFCSLISFRRSTSLDSTISLTLESICSEIRDFISEAERELVDKLPVPEERDYSLGSSFG